VEIDDAVKGVMAILELNPLLNGAEIISEMERITCWLDARENALHGRYSRMNQ
jgi:hypothetical protein